LIGIIASYLPYEDVAVSQQTQRPRVIFAENSGLTNVFPVDCITETVRIWEEAHPLQVPDEPTEVPTPNPAADDPPTPNP
jgi:hypothetical protein